MSPDGMQELQELQEAGSRAPFRHFLQFLHVMARTGRGSPASGGSGGRRSTPFRWAAIRPARGFAGALRFAGVEAPAERIAANVLDAHVAQPLRPDPSQGAAGGG